MCVVIPSARANSAFAPSAVHLTAAGADDELGKMTDDAEFAVMEFYASWCPHCQNFGPKWEAVAAFFNKGVGHDPSGTRPDPRVTVFSVDCVTEGDMCQAFTVRGYPTVLFGTLAQFKREHAKKGSGALDKIAVGSPETVIRQIGTKTGGLYVLSPAVAADAASRSRPTVDPDAAGAVDDPALPHADLADVVHATVQAYREMTSPRSSPLRAATPSPTFSTSSQRHIPFARVRTGPRTSPIRSTWIGQSTAWWILARRARRSRASTSAGRRTRRDRTRRNGASVRGINAGETGIHVRIVAVVSLERGAIFRDSAGRGGDVVRRRRGLDRALLPVRRLPLAFFGHGEGGWRFRAHQTGRRALRVART